MPNKGNSVMKKAYAKPTITKMSIIGCVWPG
jgi:hypothetical protein